MSQDKHTNIPAAVRKQEAEAEAALAALEALRTDEAAASDETSVETAANTRDTLTDASALQGPQPAEPTQAEPKPVEGKTAEEIAHDKLQAKHDVLQGKYNSEIRRMSDRLKELETQNDTLKDDLDQAKEESLKAKIDPDAAKRYLTDAEKDELDSDLLDFQSRMSRGVAEDIISQRTDSLNTKVSSLESVIDELRNSQAVAADSSFWTEAEALAPGVTSANQIADQEWISFLEGVDPTSRLPYRSLGQAAIERGDAQAVANLFNLHKSQSQVVEPLVTAKTQVKPETVHSATRTAKGPSGPQIKESEISAFYSYAAVNKLTGAEIAAKEAEFDLAAAEGRITFGR